MIYKWYEFLENRFGKRGFKTVAKKLLCDQIFFGPTVTVMVLCGLQIVEGTGMQGIKKTMKDDFVEVLVNTYKVNKFIVLKAKPMKVQYKDQPYGGFSHEE